MHHEMQPQAQLDSHRIPMIGRKIALNSGLQAVMFGSTMGAMLVTYAIIGRRLGPEQLGVVAVIVAWARVYFTATDAGMVTDIERRFGVASRDTAQRHFAAAFAVRIASLGVALTLAAFAAKLGLLLEATPVLTCAVVASVGTRLVGQLGTAVCIAHEDFVHPLLATVTAEWMGVAGFLAGWEMGFSLPALFLIQTTAGLLAVFYLLFVLRRAHDVGFARFSWSDVVDVVRAAYRLGFAQSANMLRDRSGTILLGAIASSRSAGTFSVAFSLYSAARIPAASLARAILPRIRRMLVDKTPALEYEIRRSVATACGLGLLAALGTLIVADPLVRFAFGEEFGDSVVLLRILALGSPFVFGQLVLAAVLTGFGRDTRVYRAAVAAVTGGSLLAAAMIVRMDAPGAAWAIVIVEALLLTTFAIAVLPHLRGRSRS